MTVSDEFRGERPKEDANRTGDASNKHGAEGEEEDLLRAKMCAHIELSFQAFAGFEGWPGAAATVSRPYLTRQTQLTIRATCLRQSSTRY